MRIHWGYRGIIFLTIILGCFRLFADPPKKLKHHYYPVTGEAAIGNFPNGIRAWTVDVAPNNTVDVAPDNKERLIEELKELRKTIESFKNLKLVCSRRHEGYPCQQWELMSNPFWRDKGDGEYILDRKEKLKQD